MDVSPAMASYVEEIKRLRAEVEQLLTALRWIVDYANDLHESNGAVLTRMRQTAINALGDKQ